MISEIIPHLFIGTLDDARDFDGAIYCVMNAWPVGEPAQAIWMPITAAPEFAFGIARFIPKDDMTGRALISNLWALTALITHDLNSGIDTLVHCREGRERSPLAVAFFLVNCRIGRAAGWSFDVAYAMIKAKRPIVDDCRAWLPKEKV